MMAYPSKFKALEEQYGMSIGEILVMKLNELGNIVQVSRNIGMSYDLVYAKVRDCGIVKKPAEWTLPETEHANS